MIVRAAGDDRAIALGEPLSQGAGVVDDTGRVRLELRLPGLGQCHRLGRDHVRQRAAEHHRAAAVDELGELRGGHDDAAARPPQ